MKENLCKWFARIVFASFMAVIGNLAFVVVLLFIDSLNGTNLLEKYKEICVNILLICSSACYVSAVSIVFVNIKDVWNSLK